MGYKGWSELKTERWERKAERERSRQEERGNGDGAVKDEEYERYTVNPDTVNQSRFASVICRSKGKKIRFLILTDIIYHRIKLLHFH
ncbi:Hypothetical predicted protein [Octopus vulgaris]|uniref:Uncharacterized protein n=1 Tax=Octopus vulgaris TaxID=6645 RepID=A0AA36B7F6_OCTVU|nr:Hypothetical predicted protein [Octopus vulgaris]